MNTLYLEHYDHLWFLCFVRKSTHPDDSNAEIYSSSIKKYRQHEKKIYDMLYAYNDDMPPTEDQMFHALSTTIMMVYENHSHKEIEMTEFDFLITVEYFDHQR